MIPEAGTATEFKAAVFETCNTWPQLDEVYAVNISEMWGAHPLRPIEYWILVGTEWERREVRTTRGIQPTPLRPALVFEFKMLFQNDDVVAWHPQSKEILLTLEQWNNGLADGSIKFTGFIDDPGNRNERRV